jgi:hypothetical protein
MTAARSEPPIPLTVAAYPHRNLVQVHRKGDPADVLRSVPIDVAGGELLVVDDLAAWASDLEQLLRRATRWRRSKRCASKNRRGTAYDARHA